MCGALIIYDILTELKVFGLTKSEKIIQLSFECRTLLFNTQQLSLSKYAKNTIRNTKVPKLRSFLLSLHSGYV
jgi:hypothetical protein